MSTNHYFQAGIPGGRTSEQNLYEDLIIEALQIYGFDMYYLPRQTTNKDEIFNEDPLNQYTHRYPIEMYLSNVNGFSGEGDLLTKFGVEIRDTATFVVSARRWDKIVARDGHAQLTTRPAEGDILYFPLTQSYFEIRRVDGQDPFFQLGKLYVYTLECEFMQYSSERVDTGDSEIDQLVGQSSLDIQSYQIIYENSDKMLLEYHANSYAILESFDIDSIDPLAQNDDFEDEISVLDFTETNPFGEVYTE